MIQESLQQPSLAHGHPNAPIPDKSQVFAGRYQLFDLVGSGNQTRVYRAWDQQRSQLVAVKLSVPCDTLQAQEIVREARRIALLDHGSIVRLLDVGFDDGTAYLVMPLLRGHTLARWLVERQGNGLSLGLARMIIRQLGSALVYAHAVGYAHGDLKPANVVLDNQDRTTLIDFGLSSWFAATPHGSTTPALDVGFTPAYAARELFDGSHADHVSDIYAFGCLCYELLTGFHPYQYVPSIQVARYRSTLPELPALGFRQRRLLRRMIAVERENRLDRLDDFLSLI